MLADIIFTTRRIKPCWAPAKNPSHIKNRSPLSSSLHLILHSISDWLRLWLCKRALCHKWAKIVSEIILKFNWNFVSGWNYWNKEGQGSLVMESMFTRKISDNGSWLNRWWKSYGARRRTFNIWCWFSICQFNLERIIPTSDIDELLSQASFAVGEYKCNPLSVIERKILRLKEIRSERKAARNDYHALIGKSFLLVIN